MLMPMSDQPVPAFPLRRARQGFSSALVCAKAFLGRMGSLLRNGFRSATASDVGFHHDLRGLSRMRGLRRFFHIPESHQGKPGNTAYPLAMDHGRDYHFI